jgi:hypothetical protein
LTSMKSKASLKKTANRSLKGAWAALGIPFDVSAIDEKEDGIIDVEALIMTTLLMMEQDRMATDLPAWLGRFSSLINHQKLKNMFKTTPSRHRSLIMENLKASPFRAAPNSVRTIFNLEPPSDSVTKAVQMRVDKLNTVENVAQISIMIRNRLQYGTGFRADIIALTNVKGLGVKGTQLAKVLCTNESTVSRILSDLRACRFLDQDNERTGPTDPYPGIFVSSHSLWNLCEIVDALEFESPGLKRGVLENLNLRHDGFGRRVVLDLAEARR